MSDSRTILTLRDYFAAAALTGLVANTKLFPPNSVEESLAMYKLVWGVANGMLEARKEGGDV